MIRVNIGMHIVSLFIFDIIEKLDSNLISRCPATMFAVSRTASVMGRIIFLISSITTIKFISGAGVPMGVRCSIVDFIELETAFTIVAAHIVSLIKTEIEMCAVGVKLVGSTATMLTIITKINSFFIVDDVDFFSSFPFKVFVSFSILSIRFLPTKIFLVVNFFVSPISIIMGVTSTTHPALI